MNYLSMVQDAIRWSGAHVDEPSTLSGATGVSKLFADFVAQAWEEIQIERTDWLWRAKQHVTGVLKKDSERFFLRGEDLPSADNQPEGFIDYTQTPAIVVAGDITHEIQRWTVQLSDIDDLRPDQNLRFVPYTNWRRDIDPTDSPNTPTVFTVTPEGVLMFFPVPDKDYRLYMSAPRKPQLLAEDLDVPAGLPEHLHKGIVWRAILYYGMYHQDGSLVELGRTRYRPYKKWLEKSEMPPVTLVVDALYRD